MLELSQGPKMMKTLLPGNLLDAFKKEKFAIFMLLDCSYFLCCLGYSPRPTKRDWVRFEQELG
jgi:hypothetical protein